MNLSNFIQQPLFSVLRFVFLLCFSVAITGIAEAESLRISPSRSSRDLSFLPTASSKQFFYVFGPSANATRGALTDKGATRIAFFRFRADTEEDISINVFDPDSSGANDLFSFHRVTSTRYTVYGGDGTFSDANSRAPFPTADQKGTRLASKTFSKEFDNKWYRFGPFKVSEGEVIGNWSYFKIVVEGIEGGKQNNYRLSATPSDAEGFCFTTSLYLREKAGKELKFFLEVPKGMTKFVEMNYDIDISGGTAYLDTSKRTFKLTSSRSGKWARNEIELTPEETGQRCIYRFVKGPQNFTNMTFTFIDENEQPLRLFNKEGETEAPPPVIKVEPPKEEFIIPKNLKEPCLTFVFDGSKSFDPDQQNLIYEWDFGDDSPKSNRIKTLHTYKEPGRYTVRLSINDGSQTDCAVAKISQEIVANRRPIPAAVIPKYLSTHKSGTFDASESRDTPGDVLSYRWDFGDGHTAEGVQVEHAYAKGGNYPVILTVEDDKETRCSTATLQRIVKANTPPLADAGPDIVLNEKSPDDPFKVVLDGSKSLDPDGEDLSYFWDFGDGVQAEGMRVSHIYPKGGVYKATLTVQTNDSCFPNHASTDEALILLNRSPMAFITGGRAGCIQEEIQFDASRSIDLDDDDLTYQWDFGDGARGEGSIVSHQYQNPGNYSVRLTVDDGRGTNISKHTKTHAVQIIQSPVASISPIDAAAVGQTVLFKANKTENLERKNLTYLWELETQETIPGDQINYTFKSGGTYKVKLIVDDGSGLDCGRALTEAFVRINTPPSAAISIDGKICCVDQPVKLSAAESKDPDGDDLKYMWDFGDGNTSDEVSPIHIYRKAGVFRIVLTVSDTSGLPGNTATATSIAKVNRSPIAVIEIGNP